MSDQVDSRVAELLEADRRDATARGESLGPIVEAAEMLGACCEMLRVAVDELEMSVGTLLELLNVWLVKRDGIFRWERLHHDQEEGA
jgi:hypothetical protein